MGPDGSGLTRVAASPIEDTDPSFSPVRLAFARRVRRGGTVRCRFAFAKGLGAPRSCSRPRCIRGSSEQKLIAPLRRLRAGRYLAGFATSDVLGNPTRTVALSPIRLR